MGNTESVPIPGGGTEGYHVLRNISSLQVQNQSPGSVAGLEPYFDFIIAIGNKRLDKDDESFKETLKQHLDRPLELTVFNSKTQTVRQTQIVPSNNWGGQGILGVSIRFCSFDGANQNVWHVISVEANSPAAMAGLISDTDYVLGAESVLQHADDLISLVQANVGRQVKLYVYNVEYDNVREVSLTPNDGWGGSGVLGCDIGYGYLHRIPSSVDRSQPISTKSPLLTSEGAHEAPKAASLVAQPGRTGLPQVDRINQATPTPAAPERHFPDPNEFLVSAPTSTMPTSTAPSNGINSVPSPAYDAANTVATHAAGTAPVRIESPAIEARPHAPPPQTTPAVDAAPVAEVAASGAPSGGAQWMAPATSQYQPPSQQQWQQYQQYQLPPQHQPRQPPHQPQQPGDNAHQLADRFQQMSTPSGGAFAAAPASPPIKSSTYQPYLAYGVPPPTATSTMPPPSSYAPSGYAQQAPPSHEHAQQYQPPPPAQMYYNTSNAYPMPPQPMMPTAQYAAAGSTSSGYTMPPLPPQPSQAAAGNASLPPIFNNLPMPTLSELGIGELVPQPPPQPFGQQPHAQPQQQYSQ